MSGGWSLSTEEQFYLVVPLLLLGVQRLFGPRGQAWVPLVLLALMPVVRAVSLHGAGEAGFERIYGPIHTHCDGLLVGLFLAWVSVKRPETLSAEHPHPWRWPLVAIVAGFGLRAIDATAVQLHRARIGLRGAGRPRAASRAAGSTAHRVAGVSRPVETVVRDVPHPFRGAAQAVAPVDARAGARSSASGWMLAAVAFAIAVLASALVAAVTFVLIEEPFLALRERWDARHRPVRAAPVLRRVS